MIIINNNNKNLIFHHTIHAVQEPLIKLTSAYQNNLFYLCCDFIRAVRRWQGTRRGQAGVSPKYIRTYVIHPLNVMPERQTGNGHYMLSLALSQWGLMHLRKVLSQISLCSPNQGWHFLFKLDFCLKETLFEWKISFKRKVSSLISLSRLHRLFWDDTLLTCIKTPFHRARLIYIKTSDQIHWSWPPDTNILTLHVIKFDSKSQDMLILLSHLTIIFLQMLKSSHFIATINVSLQMLLLPHLIAT